MCIRDSPFVALQSLWIGAFGSLRNVGTTLARSTPLIFTSLCACFAYRCGVFNLGGEGQFLMGSIVCCYIEMCIRDRHGLHRQRHRRGDV